MVMQPDFITADDVERATVEAGRKKELPALGKLRFAIYDEGLAAQMLHRGPFSEEGPTVARLHQYIADTGHSLRGKHHEIYLSDIDQVDPAKWKTVLRQPMA